MTLSAPGSTAVDVKAWAGLKQFTHTPSYDGFMWGTSLKAVFDTQVPSVSVTFELGGAVPGGGWFGQLRAFDASDVQIGSPTDTPLDTDARYSLSITNPNIKYLTATFPTPVGSGNAPDVASITRIEAGAAVGPETGSLQGVLAMLGAGTGAMLFRRQYRKG